MKTEIENWKCRIENIKRFKTGGQNKTNQDSAQPFSFSDF